LAELCPEPLVELSAPLAPSWIKWEGSEGGKEREGNKEGGKGRADDG